MSLVIPAQYWHLPCSLGWLFLALLLGYLQGVLARNEPMPPKSDLLLLRALVTVWAMSGNCGRSPSTMRFVQLFPKVISKSKHCIPLCFSSTSMYNLWFSEISWKPVAPWFWFSFFLCLSCWGNSFGRLSDCCCFVIFCAKANHCSVWDSSNMFYPVAASYAWKASSPNVSTQDTSCCF